MQKLKFLIYKIDDDWVINPYKPWCLKMWLSCSRHEYIVDKSFATKKEAEEELLLQKLSI